jgi:hypothetical protein
MKFFTLFALPALFIGTFAAPAAVPETAVAVEKRQIGDAYSIVEGLLSDVKQYTGAISRTCLTTCLQPLLMGHRLDRCLHHKHYYRR